MSRKWMWIWVLVALTAASGWVQVEGAGQPAGSTLSPFGSGIAPGVVVCSDPGNQPAVATVPSMVTVEGGNTVTITADNGNDPDDTTVFVSGIELKGVFYTWEVVSGAEFVASLLGSQTSVVTLTTKPVTQDSSLTLTVTVNDPAGCGTVYTVAVSITAVEITNLPPTARLTYQLEGSGQVLSAPAFPVTVIAPTSITLDAGGSTDEGPLVFAFTLVPDLIQGSAILSRISDAVRLLQIESGSQGTVSTTVTVTDELGLSDSITIVFSVEDVTLVPIAAGVSKLAQRILSPGEVVVEGETVTLDGSTSSLEDGSAPEDLVYSWRQLAGTPVSLIGSNQMIAQFEAPKVEAGDSILTFELTVRNGSLSSDPATISILVSSPFLFFPQVAFGPIGSQRFQTVLALINDRNEPAQQVTIEFFGQDGLPLTVALDGQPWDPATPITVGANSSRELRFSALDPDVILVGWARLTTDVRLEGLVLYQLIDGTTGGLDSEVSLFSSSQGTRFTTLFNLEDGLAAAIANPGSQEVRLNIKVIDETLGPDLPLTARPLILGPGEQWAQFLDENFLGPLPGGVESGTLLIEAVDGKPVVTVLKTRSGLPISTLPVAIRR
ncbi:MAG: hypothetical protein ACE5JX_09760 [Acidobacteriota bacterium]